MLEQLAKASDRIGYVIEHSANYAPPALDFAGLAGPPVHGTIQRVLLVKRSRETPADIRQCDRAAIALPDGLIHVRRRRLGVDQSPHGIEKNRMDGWENHQSSISDAS